MIQEARLTIDLKSLAHNYSLLRSMLKEETDLIAVVKANAYGADSSKIAHELSKLGTSCFAVAYAEEGAVLRKSEYKRTYTGFLSSNGTARKTN